MIPLDPTTSPTTSNRIPRPSGSWPTEDITKIDRFIYDTVQSLPAAQLIHKNKTRCISNPRWNQLGRWAGGLPQLTSRSTQIFTLAALTAIAASTPVIYPPVTLIPYKDADCTCAGEGNGTRYGSHEPKGIEIPLGSCVDIPFFKSYKATKPKPEPDVFECNLFVYTGAGCGLPAFISPDLNKRPPECYNAAMAETYIVGAKSALYTCEGWVPPCDFSALAFFRVHKDEIRSKLVRSLDNHVCILVSYSVLIHAEKSWQSKGFRQDNLPSRVLWYLHPSQEVDCETACEVVELWFSAGLWDLGIIIIVDSHRFARIVDCRLLIVNCRCRKVW